jgi:hypothetical protein
MHPASSSLTATTMAPKTSDDYDSDYSDELDDISVEHALDPQLQEMNDKNLELDTEDIDSLDDLLTGPALEALINDSIDDYPDEDDSDEAKYAAEIAKNSITEKTRTGSIR